MDIVDAHIASMHFLRKNIYADPSYVEEFNLGNGKGYSVLDIIKSIEEITGSKVATRYCSKREGDPAVLIASHEKASSTLNWSPKHSINAIVEDAWRWQKSLKD